MSVQQTLRMPKEYPQRLRDETDRDDEHTICEGQHQLPAMNGNGMTDVRDRSVILSKSASSASILSIDIWRFALVSRILASATPLSLSD
jgi:hypothetical protein